MPNPPGWRRLWPTEYWLQITNEAEATPPATPGTFAWRIYGPDKITLLACAAETYGRPADSLRGAMRFWGESEQTLREAYSRAVPIS